MRGPGWFSSNLIYFRTDRVAERHPSAIGGKKCGTGKSRDGRAGFAGEGEMCVNLLADLHGWGGRY